MSVPVPGRLILWIVVLMLVSTATLAEDTRRLEKWDLEFHDSPQYVAKLISYYHDIALTPAQETVKGRALGGLPAPCCADYSLATCCCPCNLAKSAWGLATYLVAEKGYAEDEVQAIVAAWVDFLNDSGYAGDACYKGRCNRPFEGDGCGGMDEKRIITE